jgi:hypothetical protein
VCGIDAVDYGFVLSIVFHYDQGREYFLTVGPNASNQLLSVKMDTWFKWWVTAIYTFVSTAMLRFQATTYVPFLAT